MYQWVYQWQNFENWLTFGEVMGKSLVSCFFETQCTYSSTLYRCNSLLDGVSSNLLRKICYNGSLYLLLRPKSQTLVRRGGSRGWLGWLVTPPPWRGSLLCVWLKLFRCRFVPLCEPNPGDPLNARSLRSPGFPKSTPLKNLRSANESETKLSNQITTTFAYANVNKTKYVS